MDGGGADDLGVALGGRVVLDDVEDDGGDVVGAARALGQVDELLGGQLGVVHPGEDLPDGGRGDRARQSVGAQQPAVAGDGLSDGFVELDLAVGVAQDPQQHRALRVLTGLLAGEAAGLDEVLHEGVVGGDLGELAVAQEVGARVADVDHGELVAGPHNGDAGGAQARQLGAGGGAGDQVGVGCLHGVAQQAEQIAGLVGVGIERYEVVDGDGGGDVAAGGPAHAVAQDHQVRSGVAGVLVGGPHEPDRAACGVAEGGCHGRSSSVVWPILTGTPMGSSTVPWTG